MSMGSTVKGLAQMRWTLMVALIALGVGVWVSSTRYTIKPSRLVVVAKLTGPGSINQTDTRSRILMRLLITGASGNLTTGLVE